MRIYVVFKQGVYRHECGGIFSSVNLARKAAEELIAGERDGYHSYEIVPFDLDTKTKQTPLTYGEGIWGDCFNGGELIEESSFCMGNKPHEQIEADKEELMTAGTWHLISSKEDK